MGESEKHVHQNFTELDDGKILTGHPYITDGNFTMVSGQIFPLNQSIENCHFLGYPIF